MWRTVGRIAVVFLVWGVLFALAVANGLPAGPAQLAAGMATGTTLIAWGIGLHLAQQRAGKETTEVVPVEMPRRRASV
jgi:hypothetical protein